MPGMPKFLISFFSLAPTELLTSLTPFYSLEIKMIRPFDVSESILNVRKRKKRSTKFCTETKKRKVQQYNQRKQEVCCLFSGPPPPTPAASKITKYKELLPVICNADSPFSFLDRAPPFACVAMR